MSDFVYLALTLLSFAGLALLVGVLDARLRPDPDPDPDADHDAEHEPELAAARGDKAVRR